MTDLKSLLQPLESFAEGREGNAEGGVFAFVPGRPDAELTAAIGQDVQSGHDLGHSPGCR